MRSTSFLALAAAAALLAGCSGGGGHTALPAMSTGSATASIGSGTKSTTTTTTTGVTAPAGWAATATLGGTIANASDLGALNPSQKLTVRLGLALHNESQLRSLVAGGPSDLSPQAFAAQYGATAGEIAQVTSYLQSEGFTNINAEGQLVSADATAAQVAQAFNTSLESFSLGGKNVFINTKPAFVPTALGGIVTAVLGLDTVPLNVPHPAHAQPSSTSCLLGATTPTGQCAPVFDAAGVQKFYDATTLAPATGTTVAVIAEGDVSGVVTALRYAETKQNIPQVPVSVVTVGLASSDTSGSDEWDLDTQSSTGIAGNVSQLYIYATTSLTDSDIANAYSKWTSQKLARLGNSSFGECEYQAYLDGALKVDDALFLQAAAQGQTMFASTGDVGSSCPVLPTNGVPGSGPPMVSYPASSPYVIGVGGTTALANADGSYSGEAAWNAGGGGLSQFENATTWMQTAQPTGTAGLAATNLRGLPDISMAADSTAGAYNVYGQNIPALGDCSNGCAVGGTSEASPLAMGSYARIQSAHNNGLGFAGPRLYASFVRDDANATTVNGPPPTQTAGGFHDIITGANGAYTALPGYDYTTGLGTLDVGILSGRI